MSDHGQVLLVEMYKDCMNVLGVDLTPYGSITEGFTGGEAMQENVGAMTINEGTVQGGTVGGVGEQ